MQDSYDAAVSASSVGEFYSNDFYDAISLDSRRAATVILPIVFDIVKPDSVVDVGCGTGVWLNVAQLLGVSQVLGLDGAHVTSSRQVIDPSSFVAVDLSVGPLNLAARYDLAMSLEVAEHLRIERASGFVAELCRASDAVLFSAAIPGQGGAHHINEQWLSMWVRAFESNDYVAFDVIRPVVWTNPEVRAWYKQNTMLFVNAQRHDLIDSAARAADAIAPIVDIVHPDLWNSRASAHPGLREAAKMTNAAVRRATHARLNKLLRR